MTDTAIQVQAVGKRYRVNHLQYRHTALRDVVMERLHAIPSLLRRAEHEKAIDTFWALKDVSFEVQRGEVVGIIGRNGAGKSTLLKLLSRISPPTEGRIDIFGRVGSLLEVGTGFHGDLSGRENIYLNGAIIGMNKAEVDRKLDEIVAFAEIEEFIDTPVKRYSTGMYMRLAFAVAAHLDSDIMLVDEVLAVGDLAFQNKCLKKMEGVADNGRTIVFVSHSLGLIHSLCPRTICMDHGKLLADGPTAEVIQTYISAGLADSAEYTQAHQPAKAINLRRARLLTSSGEAKNEFLYDEGIQVVLEYEVNRPIANCSVWLSIRTIEGVIAFGTADSDTDPAPLGLRKPGYYRTTVQLPAKWLNAGTYYVVAGITQYSPVVNYDRVETSRFVVLDIGTPARIRTGHMRTGVLQPFFGWNTETIQNNVKA